MTLPENELLFHLRFSDKMCYLEQIRDGVLSFSCPGRYIKEARESGDDKQGDLFEAVFARLRKSNKKILEMRELLGDDLEEIDDGDCIYLRRKSAYLIPTFCTYGYTVGKVYRDGNHYDAGRHNICFSPDLRMYDGFSKRGDNPYIYLAMIKKDTYFKNIDAACIRESTKVVGASVQYIDMANEFFINPTENYPEIFIKSDSYAYQEEYRLSLPEKKFASVDERFNFPVGKFEEENDIYLFTFDFGFQMEFSLEFDENGKVISI